MLIVIYRGTEQYNAILTNTTEGLVKFNKCCARLGCNTWRFTWQMALICENVGLNPTLVAKSRILHFCSISCAALCGYTAEEVKEGVETTKAPIALA